MKRLHPAWIVAACTFLVLLVAAGVRSTPGVLMVPLQTEFGWSRATIGFAVAVNILLYGLIGPFAASTMDAFTVSRLLRASASQSNNSSSRCRPSACTLSLLSLRRSPAKNSQMRFF